MVGFLKKAFVQFWQDATPDTIVNSYRSQQELQKSWNKQIKKLR